MKDTISVWEARDRYVIDYDHIKTWNRIDYNFHPVARLKKALAR